MSVVLVSDFTDLVSAKAVKQSKSERHNLRVIAGSGQKNIERQQGEVKIQLLPQTIEPQVSRQRPPASAVAKTKEKAEKSVFAKNGSASFRLGKTLLGLSLAFSSVLVGAGLGVVWADGTNLQGKTYTVQAGQNLWDVAKQITADGDDVSETVSAVMQLNGLPSASVAAGQVITLPAK